MRRFLCVLCCACFWVGITGCGKDETPEESNQSAQSDPIPSDTLYVQIREVDAHGLSGSFGVAYKGMVEDTNGKKYIDGERVKQINISRSQRTPEGDLCTVEYCVDGEKYTKPDVLITGKPQVIDSGSGWQIFVGTHDGVTEGKLQ